ncbi:MAG: pitrilysin family protein [Gemmatimonadota bacterium]
MRGRTRCLSMAGALCASVHALALAAAPLSAQTTEPVVYEVEGVRVVQSVQPERELVAARLYLLGGAQRLTPETAGAERLILRASARGTESFPGNSIRDAQVETGSRFTTSTGPDWSMIGFNGLAEEFDASWKILAERVARPTLDTAGVELVRAQVLTGIRSDTESPDAAVRELAGRLAFAGHPYAVEVDGTEAAVSNLTIDDLRRFHDEEFVRSRMLLSVVGPIDRATVEAAVRAELADLPLGSYTWQLPEPWIKDAPNVVNEYRDLPTNYIMGYYGGPRMSDEDYPAFQVAVVALSGLISGRIRARGYSYAAGAPLIERAASGGGIYVSTVRPDETMLVINNTISDIKRGGLRRADLQEYAENSTLEYYLSNQSSYQQADFLATSLLLRGSPQSVSDWVETLRGVEGFEVRGAADRYITNIQYGFLGSGVVPTDRMTRN